MWKVIGSKSQFQDYYKDRRVSSYRISNAKTNITAYWLQSKNSVIRDTHHV
jgi:hypothetical protein